MKGIIFTEFLEMVESAFSYEVADRLIDECELSSGGVYTAVGTYDHQEIILMVVKLSSISGIPTQDLIKAFGSYLFPRFNTLYPSFFEGIISALDFLERIESVIHVQVIKLYPDAELPKFETQRPDEHTLIMTYFSERHMADLAEGLISACIKHYGEPLTLIRENLEGVAKPVRFTIQRQP
jgi:hypothetical protein